MLNKTTKQAEAEVVPSSSLVGVEVEVEVGVEVKLSHIMLSLCREEQPKTLFRLVGGWVVGLIGIKANLNSSCS